MPTPMPLFAPVKRPPVPSSLGVRVPVNAPVHEAFCATVDDGINPVPVDKDICSVTSTLGVVATAAPSIASSELCHQTCTASPNTVVWPATVLVDTIPRSHPSPVFVGPT
ncbi:hypothetical protein PMIN06_008331 [Paraphaeosphaeria minitans]